MKHFQVYDYEGYQPNHNSSGIPSDAVCDNGGANCGRSTFDASPPARDFGGYYLSAFRAVAQRAAPAAIMCAYNALYGAPACASPVNNDVARAEWGWDGFVISDCGAVEGIKASHNYTQSDAATIAMALNQGGVDVNCGGGSPPYYTRHVCAAVAAGAIAAADVDRAARRYFTVVLRLGMLDPMEGQPLVTALGAADVDSAATRALAKAAAAESLVLLKNDGGFLPLDGGLSGGGSSDGGGGNRGNRGKGNRGKGNRGKGRRRLAAASTKFAFLGPLANATQDLLSAPQYHGRNTLVDSHSPLLVARRRGWDVEYQRGVNICDWVPPGYPNQPCSRGPGGAGGAADPTKPLPPPDTSGIAAAVAAAAAADVAVLFLGSDQVRASW
jgi:beta-glucosidase-like glycosyl hydrolase